VFNFDCGNGGKEGGERADGKQVSKLRSSRPRL
jgi:hypothetical protein